MRKSKIYLDASIPSAYHDGRKSLRQKITQQWWRNVMSREYEVYVSSVTVAELNETSDPSLRNKLIELVSSVTVLNVPEEYLPDALHIAITTLCELDIVVSWNFEHLVNPETRRKIKGVNLLRGYKEIDIVSPEELGGDRYE